MALFEIFLTFKKAERKSPGSAGSGPPMFWPYFLMFGVPLLIFLFLFFYGFFYCPDNLGEDPETGFRLAKLVVFETVRRYSFFIPFSGTAFFVLPFLRERDQVDWERLVKVYSVYAGGLWGICYFCFLIFGLFHKG